MGIDFRIDDAPVYRLTGTLTAWDEEKHYDGDAITGDELRGLFEDPPEQVSLTVESVPLMPQIPDGAQIDTPRWAHSGFDRFRRRIAETIGVDLDMMEAFFNEGYALKRYFGEAAFAPDGYEARKTEATRRWREEARLWSDIESGLVPLLHHSDCDGDLSPEECARVAPALREALEKLKQTPYDRFDDGHDWDVEKGYVLAAAMEACAKYNRRLVFC